MQEVVIVGCGEVGLAYARKALELDPAPRLQLLDPAPGAEAVEFAASTGTGLHASAGTWLDESTVVLLAVPGQAATRALETITPWLFSGATVADLSTAATESKQRSAEHCRTGGIRYVDLAITGSVAANGPRTPLLYAGPECAGLITLLERLGAPLTLLDGAEPGDAMRVKLLRSVIMKGLEALVVECVPAAEEYGVTEQLWTSLGDVDRTGFVPLLHAMLRTHAQHAARREHEVAQSAEQLEAIGRPSAMTRATQQRFAATLAADQSEQDSAPARS
ncbi:DUF1932 domain-containing protein [Saccharopolyspora gloriosae]|uniref:DUF1932 domain-containing protein n=1 Tax=Saccharopolyspora gloriosae TaxID=455344 RepID=UPI001FB83CB1|nr:DUF1932 domain-containing protein [Saccharopolyspora gloriosae]